MRRLREVLQKVSRTLSLEQRLQEAEVRRAFRLLPESREVRLVFVDFRTRTIGLAFRYPGDRDRLEPREEAMLEELERLSGHRFERILWMLDRKGGGS